MLQERFAMEVAELYLIASIAILIVPILYATWQVTTPALLIIVFSTFKRKRGMRNEVRSSHQEQKLHDLLFW
ncbi:hypothetical protein PHOSAC3_140063 [Mesotoga infera]|nr:hypothetical protein PHOSAC3_140063 [Mesotoga infera]